MANSIHIEEGHGTTKLVWTLKFGKGRVKCIKGDLRENTNGLNMCLSKRVGWASARVIRKRLDLDLFIFQVEKKGPFNI